MFNKKALSLLLCSYLLVNTLNFTSRAIPNVDSQKYYTMYEELMSKDFLSGEYVLNNILVKYSIDNKNMTIEKETIPLTENIEDSEDIMKFKYDLKNDIMEIDGSKIELETTIDYFDPSIYDSKKDALNSHNMDILNNFKHEIISDYLKSQGINQPPISNFSKLNGFV